MGLPASVIERLQPVIEATKKTPEEIWAGQSLATRLSVLGVVAVQAFWAKLSSEARKALGRSWSFWGRAAQQIPDELWFIWLILAGRGWGKTATGANFCIKMARRFPRSRGALVGATAGEVRDVMILGDSGIIAQSPADFTPKYEPSKKRLTWPNGSYALCYTADEPNRLRGPNLAWAWCDEVGAWRYPSQAWAMLMFCMRKLARSVSKDGKKVVSDPRVCITTTPRPIELLIDLLGQAEDPKNGIVVTRGSSWDNFWNLSARWFAQIVARSQGVLGRQEIWAEMLVNVEGALWEAPALDRHRWCPLKHGKLPDMDRIVVGVDPCEEDKSDSDEWGIVADGSCDGIGYVLEDWSMGGHPAKCSRRALDLYYKLNADAIVVETNRGGKFVAHTIMSVVRPGEPRPRIIEVKATRNKATRAEPIAAIYEEGRFRHVGTFAELEKQMTTYVPGITKKSPDRMDAHVWAATELFPSWYTAQ